MLNKENQKVFDEVLLGEEIRDQIKKRNESKLHTFFKSKQALNSDFDLSNYQLC